MHSWNREMAGHAGAMPPPSNLQGPFKLIPPHFICSKQAFLNFAVTAVQLQCPVTEPCGFAAATSLCVLVELVNRAAEWEAQMIGSLALPSLGNRDQKNPSLPSQRTAWERGGISLEERWTSRE